MFIRLTCISLLSGLGICLADDAPDSLKSATPAKLGSVFRTTVRGINLTRDPGTGAHFCKVQLEITWEPKYKPFYINPGTITIRYGPDKTGKELPTQQKDNGTIPVTGRSSAEIDVQVPAPDRSAATIKALEGKFSVIVPSKMLRFTIDKLKAAPVTLKQDGVEASLREFAADEDHWTARIALEYPKGGPTFESFQSWLGNNKAILEKTGGKERWPSGGERILKMTSTQAVVEYYFENSSGKNTAQWRLLYDTPGPIVEVTSSFRFKDLALP